MEDIHRTGAKRFSVAVPRRVIFSDTSMLESNRAVLPMVMGTDTYSSCRLLLHKSIIRRNRAGANLHVILGRHTNILTRTKISTSYQHYRFYNGTKPILIYFLFFTQPFIYSSSPYIYAPYGQYGHYYGTTNLHMILGRHTNILTRTKISTSFRHHSFYKDTKPIPIYFLFSNQPLIYSSTPYISAPYGQYGQYKNIKIIPIYFSLFNQPLIYSSTPYISALYGQYGQYNGTKTILIYFLFSNQPLIYSSTPYI